MNLTPGLRKLGLSAHITSSVGWIGAVLAFLALAVVGLVSQNTQQVQATYLAMDILARLVIVPLAFTALLTGLVQSLGTPWGVFRHYWVVIKLALTVFATVVLLLELESIGYLAAVVAVMPLSTADLREARIGVIVHAGGGAAVLLVIMLLSVFKPRGLTPYGQRLARSGKQPGKPGLDMAVD